MAFKLIVALAFVAVASAGLVPTAQVYQAAQPVLAKSEDAYDPHPQYQFSYAVTDAHTGDSKSQSETRDGDVVQGEYSLIDADGYKRTVQYAADSVNGFNAVVNREPLGQAVAAPALIKSAPVAYAASPAYTQAYAAPALIKSAPAYTQTYAAPALIKSAPVAYAAAPAYAQTYSAPAYAQTYSAPALIKSAPAYTQTYAAPALIKSAPVAYAAAPAYTQTYAAPALIKSAPVAYAATPALRYGAPSAYTQSYVAAAPAYAYSH